MKLLTMLPVVVSMYSGTILCVPAAGHNQETGQRTEVPLICGDLPGSAVEDCAEAIYRARQDYVDRPLESAMWHDLDCYSLGAMRTAAHQESEVLRAALLFEDFNDFFRQYDNLAMCYWSSGDFASAKHYFDGFQFLVDIHPLLEPVPHTFQTGSGRILPETPEAYRWHALRQAVRFYENAMRSSKRTICGSSGKDCRDAAWRLTNQSISRTLSEDLGATEIASSPMRSRARGLWSRLLRLKAERALLALADREQLLEGAGGWASQLAPAIRATETELYGITTSLRDIQRHDDISLAEVQSYLRDNELLLVYLQSIECRRHVAWGISRNQAKLALVKGSGQACGDSAMVKQAIQRVLEQMRRNQPLDSVKSELKWLANVLISRASLPKSGGTIYVVLDEGMAGLPFELLPAPSGKMLGAVYNY